MSLKSAFAYVPLSVREDVVKTCYPYIAKLVESGLTTQQALKVIGLQPNYFYQYADKQSSLYLRRLKATNRKAWDLTEGRCIISNKKKTEDFTEAQKSIFYNTNRVILIRKEDRINYILDGLCDFYGMTRQQLRMIYRKKWIRRRRMAMKLLYEIADCALKDITEPMGYKPNTLCTIQTNISVLNEEIFTDHAVKNEYKSILKHLNL
jgi:hypothetical protein